MTAPIVWQGNRQPIAEINEIGPLNASVKVRAMKGFRTFPGDAQIVGDLWRREAERDVQAHGEPVKAGRGFPRWGGTGQRRPSPVWAEYPSWIADEIERRRPEMRAAPMTRESER